MNHEHTTHEDDLDGPDDLELFIEECTRRNPEFPRLVAEAEEERRRARAAGEL